MLIGRWRIHAWRFRPYLRALLRRHPFDRPLLLRLMLRLRDHATLLRQAALDWT